MPTTKKTQSQYLLPWTLRLRIVCDHPGVVYQLFKPRLDAVTTPQSISKRRRDLDIKAGHIDKRLHIINRKSVIYGYMSPSSGTWDRNFEVELVDQAVANNAVIVLPNGEGMSPTERQAMLYKYADDVEEV